MKSASLVITLASLFVVGCRTNNTDWLAEVHNEQPPWAVHGTIVGEDGVEDGWVVFHRGIITAIEQQEDRIPPNARRVSYDGYIFPGLIDTHNHAPWNVVPQWRAGHPFESRYGWLTNKIYLDEVNNFFRTNINTQSLQSVALKYTEIRAVVGGTTALQSTYPSPQPRCLIRNLDANYFTDSRIKDIQAISTNELKQFEDGFSSGRTRRLFLHIGEGKSNDVKCAQEFPFLESHGLARNGVVVIHGVALNRPDFRVMAKQGMYLVWSPESNLVLYGETAKVLEAMEEGVTVALAPDWTITGSDNVLGEMKVAWSYSQTNLSSKLTPKQIFRMATVDAAKVAGVDHFLGRISPKFGADFFLAPKHDPDPYKSLLLTQPKELFLVFVDGLPVYGSLAELGKWFGTNAVDTIEVQREKKGIVTLGDPLNALDSGQHYQEITNILTKTLGKLAPLIEN